MKDSEENRMIPRKLSSTSHLSILSKLEKNSPGLEKEWIIDGREVM